MLKSSKNKGGGRLIISKIDKIISKDSLKTPIQSQRLKQEVQERVQSGKGGPLKGTIDIKSLELGKKKFINESHNYTITKYERTTQV